MSAMEISGAGAPYGQPQDSYTATVSGAEEAAQAPAIPEEDDGQRTLIEMMREAKEKADQQRERLKLPKNTRYGDAPLEAYARLNRARTQSDVSAAAGYARRRIVQLQAAKRQDSDNADRIQAAINQLQKAVQRAGKKNRELDRERLDQSRQKKLMQEKRTREARRQKQELLRKQAMRRIRESGYLREAEVDNRMQNHIAAVDMELREQAQKLASSIQPSMEAVAQQYAADSAAMALPEELPPAAPGGEINLQA